jgi:large subunit ribosomal protein L21
MTGEARGKGAHDDMFAVIQTGGKQYKVSPGQTVEVEKLPALPGDTVELGQVLLISTDDNQTLIGAPMLEDAKIVARVAQAKRGPKIVVFKYKSKSRYRRKNGHRQDYTALTIEDIWANVASLLPAKAEEEIHTTETEEEAAGVEAAEAAATEVAAAEEAEENGPTPELPKRRAKKSTESSEAAETAATETAAAAPEASEADTAGETGPKKTTRRPRKGE